MVRQGPPGVSLLRGFLWLLFGFMKSHQYLVAEWSDSVPHQPQGPVPAPQTKTKMLLSTKLRRFVRVSPPQAGNQGPEVMNSPPQKGRPFTTKRAPNCSASSEPLKLPRSGHRRLISAPNMLDVAPLLYCSRALKSLSARDGSL